MVPNERDDIKRENNNYDNRYNVKSPTNNFAFMSNSSAVQKQNCQSELTDTRQKNTLALNGHLENRIISLHTALKMTEQSKYRFHISYTNEIRTTKEKKNRMKAMLVLCSEDTYICQNTIYFVNTFYLLLFKCEPSKISSLKYVLIINGRRSTTTTTNIVNETTCVRRVQNNKQSVLQRQIVM